MGSPLPIDMSTIQLLHQGTFQKREKKDPKRQRTRKSAGTASPRKEALPVTSLQYGCLNDSMVIPIDMLTRGNFMGSYP